MLFKEKLKKCKYVNFNFLQNKQITMMIITRQDALNRDIDHIIILIIVCILNIGYHNEFLIHLCYKASKMVYLFLSFFFSSFLMNFLAVLLDFYLSLPVNPSLLLNILAMISSSLLSSKGKCPKRSV